MRIIHQITTRLRSLWGLIAVMLIIAHAAPVQAAVTVSATLNKAAFPVDEPAQLLITVNGTRSVDLRIPDTEGFTIYQRGKSSQINMVNGSFSSSIAISCILEAHTPGKYTIPEIQIIAEDTTLSTESIPFEVTPANTPPPQSQQSTSDQSGSAVAGGNATFIRMIKDDRKTYIGEILPVEIKAYFRQGLRANLNSSPILVGDGLVMPQIHDQPRQTQEYVNGTVFNVLSWDTTLSNIKEGKHPIHVELEATQLIPQRRTSTSVFGSRSPFDDDFFDSVFGGYKQRPLKVVSEVIECEVLPLPEEGKPDSFTGAIGDFSLIAKADPLQVETGEPLTLKMTVGGTGNFDRVEAPQFPDASGWKTYTATSEFLPQNDSTFIGKKVFEQAVVAQSSTLKEIPSLAFSYFDPKKGVYITKRSEPIQIIITGKNTPPAAPPPTAAVANPQPQPEPAAQEPKAAFTGLAPLHLDPGKPVAAIKPLYNRAGFITLIIISLFTLLGTGVYKLWLNRSVGSPEDVYKRARTQQLQAAYATLDSALATGDSHSFLAASRSTIQNHLGSLWYCEPNTITRADIAHKIPQHPELIEIFTIAEQAAYSGSTLSRETMERYSRNLKNALETMI